jgi:hypothetical protein
VSGGSKLLLREKLALRGGLLRDLVIWSVPKSSKYPESIRYRLALVDIEAERVLVLFDNHFPKGHHRHLKEGGEIRYPFTTVEQLLIDFLTAAGEEEKK